MEVKVAKTQDAPVIHDLMMRAFSEYKTMPASSSALDETVQSVTLALTNGEQALICYIDGTPCGMVRYEVKEDALYFFRLSVSPEYQGKGLAKALLAALEDTARDNGLQKIQCKVRMSIEKNMRLYQAYGYTQYNQSVLHMNGVDLDVAWMEKNLSK